MTSPISRRHLLAVAPAVALSQDVLSQTIAATAAEGLLLQAGVHRIGRDTIVRGDVHLEPGARIEVARGATLTVMGDFSAPISHVFTGDGRIDLSQSRAIEAYPEWWGAIGENGAFDCAQAIEACLASHSLTRLGAHSYFVSRTIAVERTNRRIIGSGQRWTGPGTATRIVLTGSGDVLRLGTMRKPASVNDFVQGLLISDLQLTRANPAAGSGHDAPSGVRARFILFSEIVRVDSAESVNGFAVSGAVRSFFRECSAFRSPAGGNRSSVFRGFACDGNTDIGLAGGNASIFFVDCNARTGGEPRLTENVGMLLDGAYADTVVSNFETAAVAVGIRMSGKASAMGRPKQRTGFIDVRIVGPILDQCSQVGIEVTDTSDHALIDITDPYVALGPDGRAALSFNGSRGLLSVRGGQLVGWADRELVGVDAVASDGLDISGLKLLNLRTPVRMQRCRDLSLDVAINLPEGGSGRPAVQLSDCAEGHVRARVKGAVGAFGEGLLVSGAQSASLSVDSAAISPSAVGGADRRVRLDRAPATAVSLRS